MRTEVVMMMSHENKSKFIALIKAGQTAEVVSTMIGELFTGHHRIPKW